MQVGQKITLKNARPKAVTVQLQEKLFGDWEIVQESEQGEKQDANTQLYSLKVPGKGSFTIEYLARIKW